MQKSSVVTHPVHGVAPEALVLGAISRAVSAHDGVTTQDAREQDPFKRRWGPLLAVCLAHAVLLWWATELRANSVAQVVQPSVIGVLVSAPVTEPVPLPLEPEPKPKPKPVVQPRPKPVPLLPSEKAVTLPPPPEEPPPQVEAAVAPVAPVATPAPPEPKELAPVVPPRTDASHLNNPVPVYPSVSRRLGEQGRVLLDVYILPDGRVGEIKLRRSSGYPRLDQAAREAVQRWRYVPARRGNEPIPYWYVQPLDFVLGN